MNKFFIKNKILKMNKAFTLVELMVATTLFTIIMLMGVGSLVSSSGSARYAGKLRVAVDNVNFAVESMARELKTATKYYCTSSTYNLSDTTSVQDCNGGNLIAFVPQQTAGAALRVSYGISNSRIERCEYITSTTCAYLVSSDVSIQSLKFYVKGADASTTYTQPSVKMLVKGQVMVKDTPTTFSLETMASQRSSE